MRCSNSLRRLFGVLVVLTVWLVGRSSALAQTSQTVATILKAGHGIAVVLNHPLKLQRLNVGDHFTLDVIDQGVPFHSSVESGNRLPKGTRIMATVISSNDMHGKSRKVAIICDQLSLSDGRVLPFIGGMPADDPCGLPAATLHKRSQREGAAASREGLAVSAIWSGNGGPISILMGVAGMKLVNKYIAHRLDRREAKELAITIIEDDIPASKFYVVPTSECRVKM